MTASTDDLTDRSVRDYLCRTPDWRYRLAVEYATHRRKVRPLLCPIVDQCVACIRFKRDGGSELVRFRTHGGPQDADYRPLYCAHEVYSNPAYSELKLELETRILGGQLDVHIAQATGLPEVVCERFEQVFFNVRQRLGSKYYIMFEVICRSPFDSDSPEITARQSLYRLAYSAGSHATDVILAVRHLLVSNRAEECRQLICQQLLVNPKLRSLLTADRLQPLGLAAEALLTDLLGGPLHLPRETQATCLVPDHIVAEPRTAVLQPANLRAAG